MAQVTFNSRLVEMEIADAATVPATNDFLAVRDARNRPMIITIDTKNVFRIILEDHGLNRYNVDLGAAIGLGNGEIITAYAVQQSLDSTIFLVAASGRKDDPSWSRIFVLKPFKPSDVDLFSPEAIRDLVIPQTMTLKFPVRKILMGKEDTLRPYPLVVIAYHEISRVSDQEFIARIKVEQHLASWSLATDLSLPLNVDKILDFYPGTVAAARGIFVLYEISGNRSIVFTAYSALQNSGIQCPPNATRLITFTNAKGKDDLIIAGDGLWHVPASSLGRSNAKCKLLINTPAFSNITDLDVSEVEIGGKPVLSIWVSNSRNGINYLKFDSLDITGIALPEAVQVIPEGQGGLFTSFMDERGNQSLVYANEEGNLCLLEQAVENGLWKEVPFLVQLPGQSHEIVPSYLCTVVISDSKSNFPVPDAFVHVSSTGWVNLTANGKPYYLTPDGMQLQADSTGEIAFVLPTTDISSTTLMIDSAKQLDGSVLKLESAPIQIDPSHQTIKKLRNFGNLSELKDAKDAFGEPVFVDCTITDTEFNNAAKAFKTLESRHEELRSGVGSVTRRSAITVMTAEITFSPWSWFHWIERQASKVVRWSVQIFETAWTFVVELGNKAYNFILDSVETVKKAISWVWTDLIKKPFEEMIRWLGFTLLKYGKAILATSELVSGMLNATLACGSARLVEAADSTEEVFNNMKDTMHKALDNTAAVAHRDSKLNADNKKSDPTIIDDALDWIRYQIKRTSKSLTDQAGARVKNKEEVKGVTSVVSLWQDLLQPFLEEMSTTFLKLIESLLSLFESSSTLTVQDVLQQIGADLLIGLVGSVQRIVVGALRVLGNLMDDIKTIINEPFQLPGVLGSILNSLGIKLPSLLGVVSFVIAIPTALIRLSAKGANGEVRGLPQKFNSDEMEQSFRGTLKDTNPKRHREISRFTSELGVAIVPISALLDLGGIVSSTLTAGSGITGPAKLRKIEGAGTLLINGIVALSAWPMDPSIPASGARKAIALLGAGSAVVELLISWFVTSPGKLKAVACVEMATVLITLVLLPVVYEAELEAAAKKSTGNRESIAHLTYIGRTCTYVAKVAANGAVILVDPVSIAGATGVCMVFNAIGGAILISRSTESLEANAWDQKT